MKRFFQSVFSQVTSLFVALFLLGAIFLFGIFVLLAVFQEPPIVVEDDSILVVNLSMSITDSPMAADPFEVLRGSLDGSLTSAVHLKGFLDTLDRAAKDKRIKALFLHSDSLYVEGGPNYATILELRQAIREFQKSGKPVIAYLATPGIKEYLLCADADHLILNPYGTVLLKGLVAERFYLAGAFEKYGIGIQTNSKGRYKSYGETYIRSEMSDEDREQIAVLAGSLWNTVLDEVAESRGIDREELARLTNEIGLFAADKALEVNLVDRLAYIDEVIETLIEKGALDEKSRSFRQISLAQYRLEGKSPFEKMMAEGHPQVAVVYAEGEIVDGEGSTGQVGGTKLSRTLRKIRKNPDVKAVVLRVNSPGGSAFASEMILREVKLLAADRPVIVSMGGVAASGGYWISSLSDFIYTEPTTITGSIGVFSMMPNIETIANEHGVTFDRVKTAQYADIFSLSRPKSEAEMNKFGELSEFIYSQFLDRVVEGRGKSREEIESIAEGRVWSGSDAVEIGLADQLGGLEDAIAHAVADAALGDENWKLIQYPAEKEMAEVISEMLGGEMDADALIPQLQLPDSIERINQCVEGLQNLNDPLGIYARLPYNLHIE